MERRVIETRQYWGMVNSAAWSPDGSNICTGRNDSTALIWNIGGTILDWAAGIVCTGGNALIFKELLGNYENVEGMCSEMLIFNLCCFASKVEKFHPERYKELCQIIEMLAVKSGAPL